MRISDWSSDVCSSDLRKARDDGRGHDAGGNEKEPMFAHAARTDVDDCRHDGPQPKRTSPKCPNRTISQCEALRNRGSAAAVPQHLIDRARRITQLAAALVRKRHLPPTVAPRRAQRT